MDKRILFKNISFMLKKLGKKVGELEAEAGVSPGYISRTSKDENTKPGIEFIMNVANAFNISIDTLLKVDMSYMSPTEQYLIPFLEKLISDTFDSKLDWQRETAEHLNKKLCVDVNGICDHPLFTEETLPEDDDLPFPQKLTKPIFSSHSYGNNTYIAGDCFKLRMKNGMYLYIMDAGKMDYKAENTVLHIKEIWMCTCQNDKRFLCCTKDNLSEIAMLIKHLYNAICENEKHPKLSNNIRSVINAFMNDDMEDD